MLGGRDGALLHLALMLGSQIFQGQFLDPLVIHAESETPVVFRSDIPGLIMLVFGSPGIVAPPHVPEREEIEDLRRIVGLLGLIVPVGVHGRIGIVQEKGLTVPMEPQVLILLRLVIAFIELRHHLHRIAVIGPEGELRRAVAFLPHGFHRLEEQFPLVPVADPVGDVQDEDVDAGILQHGQVPAHQPGVLAQEIAGLRFAPVIAAVFPERVTGIQPGRGILLQDPGHIRIGAGDVMVSGSMPGDIEDTRKMAAVLDGADGFLQRHLASQGIRRHPGVAHEVRRVLLQRRTT